LWAEHNQRPPEVFDTRRGWAQQALGGLDVRPITGSHLTVLVEPLARFTTAVLADVLGEARGTRAGRDLREERDPPPDTLPPNARR
jgi:hypothetical protein